MERLAYSVKEAGAAIGVSPRTIVREIQRGRLRAIRVSRRVVIPAEALAEFLGCRNMAVAAAASLVPTREPR